MSSFPYKKILHLLTAAILVWLGIRYLLPIALPFLLGGLLALAAEPVVRLFHHRLKLPRGLCVGIGVTLTLCLLTLTLTVLGALLLRQLQTFVSVIPDLEGTAQAGLSSLENWLTALAAKAPSPIRSLVLRAVESLFAESNNLVDKFSSWILHFASGIMNKLPDRALVLGTCLIAGYMISARLPQLRCQLAEKMPLPWVQTIRPTLTSLKQAIGGWVTAQLKLMVITFAVLGVGLWLLRVDHAFVWAAGISLVDALPILGSGIILIPWSIVCFIQGDLIRGAGLLGIYAAAAVMRSILEPKLVGKQLGLDPLLTLAAIYAGYKLWGFGGMLVAPLLTVTARELLSAHKDF